MEPIKLPENYTERPMANELDLVTRVHGRYKGTGFVMPQAQRNIYKNISKLFVEEVVNYRSYPKVIHKPTVVDVGCGVGIGANILSQEAQFVWGIDTNDDSISYARQMFERQPNNIYYTPQLSFDVVDVTDEDRGLAEFDYVTCVEVIEHIPKEGAVGLLQFLNRFVKKDKKGKYIEDNSRTKIFLTTPNRNSPNLQQDTPRNEHHCYETSAVEMYQFLIQHYKGVTVLDEHLQPQELSTTATPLVFKLEFPMT